jgi:tetratricopeptide (TPR) repeat protein
MASAHEAKAQAPAKPSAADVELAKRHFELGKTYYNQAAYYKALEAFEESHKLSRRPELLFNIGKCHESLGNLKRAIAYYRRFLEAKGPDPNIEARIRNLEARLEASRAKPEPTPAPVKPTPPPEPAPSARPKAWMPIAGWSLVGLGVVSIGTSIALGAAANGKAGEVEEAFQEGSHDWADLKSTESAGEGLNVGMIVTLTVGIAAAAGGTALLLLAPKPERRVSLTPRFDRAGAGMTASWRF